MSRSLANWLLRVQMQGCWQICPSLIGPANHSIPICHSSKPSFHACAATGWHLWERAACAGGWAMWEDCLLTSCHIVGRLGWLLLHVMLSRYLCRCGLGGGTCGRSMCWWMGGRCQAASSTSRCSSSTVHAPCWTVVQVRGVGFWADVQSTSVLRLGSHLRLRVLPFVRCARSARWQFRSGGAHSFWSCRPSRMPFRGSVLGLQCRDVD